jgi:putative transposase
MPRKLRFHIPGAPVHAVQRGHNKAAVFFDDFDYLEYLRCLKQAADACGCAIHAYVLMINHVHLLMTPQQPTSIARLFQSLGRHYVRYINETYDRHGSLWEGRYKSAIVQSQTYQLTCQRYIEMNPVRAGMADHPARYRWSSYGANALGVSNPILSKHAEYLSLGRSPEARQSAYRGLFDTPLDEDEIGLLRAALQTGTPLGSDKFRSQIEAVSGRKVGFLGRGRPNKSPQGTG